MEKLELKHLSPYLPYELQMMSHGGDIYTLHGLSFTNEIEPCTIRDGNFSISRSNIKFSKPILRPLSNITKDIYCNNKKIIPLNVLCDYVFLKSSSGTILKYDDIGQRLYLSSIHSVRYLSSYNSYPIWLTDRLYQWHFDVFGLIEKGLAIDINTLNQNQ